MRKIVLLCLAALLLLTQTAAASSDRPKENKFVSLICSEIKANGEHSDGVRLEFGLSREELSYHVHTDAATKKQLVLDVPNSRVKKLKRHVKLDNAFVKEVHLDRTKGGGTRITLDTPRPLDEMQYNVYLLAADKTLKQPARLVAEIYREKKKPATGLKGKTIVLDAGHGGSDPGAIGPNGVQEKTVTFAVTQKLAGMLEAAGANVALTRSSDVDVYGPNASDAQELQARVNVAERHRADVFVSIHANSFSSPSAHGTGTYYYSGSRAGQKLAQSLQRGMIAKVDLADRGLSEANFYVLKRSSMPAALVELAFISNYREERLLADDAFQRRLAEGLYDGLTNYFK